MWRSPKELPPNMLVRFFHWLLFFWSCFWGEGIGPTKRMAITLMVCSHCSTPISVQRLIKNSLLPSATKLRRCVCGHGGGGIPACLAGGIPACLAAGLRGGVVSQHALQQVSRGCLLPGGGGACSWQGVWRRPSPPGQQTATVADGTHPTGMHSCVELCELHKDRCDTVTRGCE